MDQERLALYTVDMKLIRNMHNMGDDRVFSVSPQVGKENRPFVGLIIVCEKRQYCVPLSSPKKKHTSMKNGHDFHRVMDRSGKLIGVLDFNNMIPVRDDVVRRINIKINPHDSEEIKRYKLLLRNQIDFCQKNQEIIVKKANTLYHMVNRKSASIQMKSRCLDWSRLEDVLDRYEN